VAASNGARSSRSKIPRARRIVEIAGSTTRKLTRALREKGAQSACIMEQATSFHETAAVKAARSFRD